ncbi:NUDIX domain-containing protein [Longispora albida]|uniref:NUDIX domain-containing protein n=1 Tax=Longispora albida TaxID=203523 RepID=UPI00316ABD7A
MPWTVTVTNLRAGGWPVPRSACPQSLLRDRDKRPDDPHAGKYLGLGGHAGPGEDVVSCARREISEESPARGRHGPAGHRTVHRLGSPARRPAGSPGRRRAGRCWVE